MFYVYYVWGKSRSSLNVSQYFIDIAIVPGSKLFKETYIIIRGHFEATNTKRNFVMSSVLRTTLQQGCRCGCVFVLSVRAFVHKCVRTDVCVVAYKIVYLWGWDCNNSFTHRCTLTVCFNVTGSSWSQFPRNVPNNISQRFFTPLSWCPLKLNVCFIITSWKVPKPSFLSQEQLCKQNTLCNTENVSLFPSFFIAENIAKQEKRPGKSTWLMNNDHSMFACMSMHENY